MANRDNSAYKPLTDAELRGSTERQPGYYELEGGMTADEIGGRQVHELSEYDHDIRELSHYGPEPHANGGSTILPGPERLRYDNVRNEDWENKGVAIPSSLRDDIPYGTLLHIPGHGVREVVDTGVPEGRIDVLVGSEREANSGGCESCHDGIYTLTDSVVEIDAVWPTEESYAAKPSKTGRKPRTRSAEIGGPEITEGRALQ